MSALEKTFSLIEFFKIYIDELNLSDGSEETYMDLFEDVKRQLYRDIKTCIERFGFDTNIFKINKGNFKTYIFRMKDQKLVKPFIAYYLKGIHGLVERIDVNKRYEFIIEASKRDLYMKIGYYVGKLVTGEKSIYDGLKSEAFTEVEFNEFCNLVMKFSLFTIEATTGDKWTAVSKVYDTYERMNFWNCELEEDLKELFEEREYDESIELENYYTVISDKDEYGFVLGSSKRFVGILEDEYRYIKKRLILGMSGPEEEVFSLADKYRYIFRMLDRVREYMDESKTVNDDIDDKTLFGEIYRYNLEIEKASKIEVNEKKRGYDVKYKYNVEALERYIDKYIYMEIEDLKVLDSKLKNELKYKKNRQQHIKSAPTIRNEVIYDSDIINLYEEFEKGKHLNEIERRQYEDKLLNDYEILKKNGHHFNTAFGFDNIFNDPNKSRDEHVKDLIKIYEDIEK